MAGRGNQSDPVRICFPFVGNNVGGSHISALMLIKGLDRDRFDPVVVLHEEGLLARFLQREGQAYEVIEIDEFMQPASARTFMLLQLATQTPRLMSFLRHHRIDIVHVNDSRMHFGWALATKLSGRKLVWHQRQGLFGPSTLKRYLASLANRIICISNYTLKNLPRNLRDRAVIVENPFDTSLPTSDRSLAKAEACRKIGVSENSLLVGYFGSLVQRKRPDVFLQAAAEIGEVWGKRPVFLLLGKALGDSNATLRKLAEQLGISNRVHFLGFHVPIEPWIAACDLVIAPAVREGLGRNVIEAMLLETPVVAADDGGHSEIIDNEATGLLVAPDNPKLIARAARRILEQPEFASALASRAKVRATERYSVRQHVDRMADIYLSCLHRPEHQ